MYTKRIVIVGAGFGGVHAYLELVKRIGDMRDIQITLINKTDYFWFVPMAHEVATGNLNLSSVKQPLRTLPQVPGFDFIQGDVVSINLDEQTVEFVFNKPITGEEKETTHILHYDYLINAVGAQTNFFGIEGADQWALPLKSLDNVRRIKNHTLRVFEEAQCCTNEEDLKTMLRFVIVGGGPTGVELAGEFADICNKEVRRLFPKLAPYVEVVLLQRGDTLIAQGEDWFSQKTHSILTGKGVRIILNAEVNKVEETGVWYNDTFISSRTVIWTAGVEAVSLPIKALLPLEYQEKTKRIKVTPFLNTSSYQNVFVVGDQAWVFDKEHGQGYPMRAQFAVRQGRCAAKNIMHLFAHEPLEEFHWKDKGFIMSLGNGEALAHILGIRFRGPFAWWLYRTAYLPQIIGSRARIKTVVDWTLNLFLPRDMSEI